VQHLLNSSDLTIVNDVLNKKHDFITEKFKNPDFVKICAHFVSIQVNSISGI